MRKIEKISKEWVEQWSEIQQEVEKTCARIAREMAGMRAALDSDMLTRLQDKPNDNNDVLERLASLREQITGIFGHISRMGKEAEAFRKDLEKLGPAQHD